MDLMSFEKSPNESVKSELTLETDLTTTAPMAVEEGSDPETENLELSGLVQFVNKEYQRSKDKRWFDENRWLEAYRNYRGLYGPEVQFTSTEKSQAFIKITKTKVLAAYAQMVDVLFAGNKFPIGIEPSENAKTVEDSIYMDPKEPEQNNKSTVNRSDILKLTKHMRNKLGDQAANFQPGPGLSPTAITYEPAKDAARKMEKKIHDQLDEANAVKHLRYVAFECALFGSGCLKGPFTVKKEYPKWDESGAYTPYHEDVPDLSAVSIWDIYPDADAVNMTEAEKFIQRHKLSKSSLRGLKKRPYFREESIDNLIASGPNYVKEYWEDDLNDNTVDNVIDRWEVLEYWGIVDKEIAEESGLEIPKEYEDVDQVQVNVWISGDQILRIVFNPFTPVRIPYHVVPYEMNPYSFFGVGVAENMSDTQLVMNGFWRLAIDNGILSSNLIFEIDEGMLTPGQDLEMYPGKILRRQTGAPGQGLFSHKVDNITTECLMIFDKARQLADEATGLPSYSHGMTGVMNVGRTASGMSMLMGAAAQNIKAVVRNIDDYLLSPLGKAMFAFNMQFNFDKDYIGDVEIVAKGTESLMKNEVRSQKLLQFLQITSNPMDAPFVKRDYILRELATALDLDEEKVVNDPREAMLHAQVLKEMGITPEQQQGPQNGSQNNPASVPQPNGSQNTGVGEMTPSATPAPQEEGYTRPDAMAA